MPRNAWRHIPAFCFALLVVVLVVQFKAGNPAQKPSPLMGKPVPSFNLATLQRKSGSLKDSDLTKNGRVSAVNFFASWCATCAGEQRHLSALRDEQRPAFACRLPIFGKIRRKKRGRGG